MKFAHICVIFTLFQRGICNGNSNLSHNNQPRRVNRIIGGHTAFIYAFPSMACLILKTPDGDDFRGGAVIIADYWVLTAAHCMTYITLEDVMDEVAFVRSNTASWKENYNERLIIERHVHEQYDSGTTDYDIAVLKVKDAFNGRNEKPARLPDSNFKYSDGSVAAVVGWGTTDPDADEPFVVDNLRFTNVAIVNLSRCQNLYRVTSEQLTDRMVCALSPGKDACVYDSGGPLYQDSYLIGLVSWGSSRCADEVLPGVYTKLAIFREWIVHKIEDVYIENRRNYVDEDNHLNHKSGKRRL